MDGKISMAARWQVTATLQVQYRKAAKAQKSRIWHRFVAITLRRRCFCDDAWVLLENVGAWMGMPCAKYLAVMFDL